MSFTTILGAPALAQALTGGNLRIFDCSFDLADPRAGETAYRAGHLPGARYLDLERDLSGPGDGHNGRHPLPDPEVFAETLRRAGLSRDQQVVAYDSSGGPYAARLWWMLRWLGHDTVAVLDGGKQAWVDAGFSLEAGPAPEARGDFVATADPERIVDASSVLDNIATRLRLVIDARSPERFAGAPHPLDTASGHIPGARNHFYATNLAADGRFKPPAALRSAFETVLAGTAPADTILQCGSGVTACHDLLAMEIAGLPGARLYPGSWSEWTADPSRPIETGV